MNCPQPMLHKKCKHPTPPNTDEWSQVQKALETQAQNHNIDSLSRFYTKSIAGWWPLDAKQRRATFACVFIKKSVSLVQRDFISTVFTCTVSLCETSCHSLSITLWYGNKQSAHTRMQWLVDTSFFCLNLPTLGAGDRQWCVCQRVAGRRRKT